MWRLMTKVFIRYYNANNVNLFSQLIVVEVEFSKRFSKDEIFI